jgi:lipopolysaccharide/colanic/teichoic acid biosynthesis glycosyltransferase
MITTTTPTSTRDVANPHAALLPEKLGASGLPLVMFDTGAAIIVLIGGLIFDHGRSALLALTPAIAFAWWSGRYRVSFAVTAADELYTTLAVTLSSGLILAVAVPVLRTGWIATYGCLFAWTGISAAGAIVLCSLRRRPQQRRLGVCDRVDHIGRARSRSAVVRLSVATADFALAFVALVLLSPLFLVCALAIVKDSGLPVFFRQRRVGLNDREFLMLKFRTMRADSGDEWVVPGDDRVTRVGEFLRRTSLDELPQLWNVLKGEMSLVGPRPEMSEYADRFSAEIVNYSDRHLVPPGITGWAQICYDRNFRPSEVAKVLPYDLFYVTHRSLALYMFCIVKTLCEVLAHPAL